MSFSTLDYSCLDDINIGGLWTALTAAIQPDNVTLLNSPDQSEPSSSRFAEPVTEQTLVQLKEATTPSGTRTMTNWVYSMWQEWARNRNKLSETYGEVYPCAPVSLHETIAEEFNFWLACFNLGDDMTLEVQRAEKKSLVLTFNLH